MGKTKSKRHQVRSGSRLKLQDGKFARAIRTPKPYETTVLVLAYRGIKSCYDKDRIKTIPMGQIVEVVHY